MHRNEEPRRTEPPGPSTHVCRVPPLLSQGLLTSLRPFFGKFSAGGKGQSGNSEEFHPLFMYPPKGQGLIFHCPGTLESYALGHKPSRSGERKYIPTLNPSNFTKAISQP